MSSLAPRDARVRIAVQKSGRLHEASVELFTRCGLHYSRGRDQLVCAGENMPVDLLLVRDDDIPSLVRDGVCDMGIVGRNTLEEALLESSTDRGTAPELLRELDFGQCRLSLAGPEDTPFHGRASIAGQRIATSYPRLLRRYLQEQAIEAEIVTYSGAVEIAPGLGEAGLICDLVSTGTTLAAHRLAERETVLQSSACLIVAARLGAREEWVQRLVQRVDGVQQVRESKYIMLHAPRSALKRICELLPGSESPTVLPLEGRTDRVAVHAVCRETVFWETLESLKQAGASAMLVLPVEKMLA